jgi:cob(I)alamin adenosyltransferase
MKIYTKTGDEGTTSLIGGTRVPKNHPRVMAYGDVDELISYIGLLRCEIDNQGITLRRIQENLMYIAAHLAADNSNKKIKEIGEEELLFLEEWIDGMTSRMPPQYAFILPSIPRTAALCHIARTVCRRAERSAIAIDDKSESLAASVKYLNRLSDFLFTLGRFQNFVNNISEDFWLV